MLRKKQLTLNIYEKSALFIFTLLYEHIIQII